MVKIVNLTLYDINIGDITIYASGIVARSPERFVKCQPLSTDEGDIPLVNSTIGSAEGIPSSQAGVIYIVSRRVADIEQRKDLYHPGELIRDLGGRVMRCKNLCSASALNA